MRLLLKNAHLYRHQAFSDTDVLIEDGIIKKIGACNEEADQVIDLHGALLSHNFIDIHTHLREPGFELFLQEVPLHFMVDMVLLSQWPIHYLVWMIRKLLKTSLNVVKRMHR